MMRVLVDTNVFVKGALDSEEERDSPERKIIELLLEGQVTIICTSQLLEEYCRVARRIVHKDFSSWLRHLILTAIKVIFITDSECGVLRDKFRKTVPEEDLDHFVACVVGRADYLISKNREFLKQAKNNSFKCVTPEEFLKGITI